MSEIQFNGVQFDELSQEEMLTTEGGGIIGDAFYAVGHAAGRALAWMRDNTPEDGLIGA